MHCPTLSELPTPPHGRKGWPWTEETRRLPEAMSDGRPWPKIGIVTPSFNQATFIEETMRSVLLQGYPNLEYFVLDGASTDGSVDVIKKYDRWLTSWASEPDRGQSHAINKGFQRANGQIYTWLNSDDYLLKDTLEGVAAASSQFPDAGGWCGGCVHVDANGRQKWVRWPKRLDAEGLADWNENWFGQPAFFFSRTAWDKCGPLDESLHYGMDIDLWFRFAKQFSIHRMNKEIAVARIHSDAKTERDKGQMYAYQCLIQIRHGYERIALRDIAQAMNAYLAMARSIDRIASLPLVRWLLVPAARKLLRMR